MRTYGKFAFRQENGARPMFVVAATSHVRDRFKRNFPGCKQDGHGQLYLAANRPNARDFAWFIDRWPLEPHTDVCGARLAALAAEHRAGEDTMERIFAGDIGDLGIVRKPALEPRDYQLLVPAMLRAKGFLVLGDELGLGKTFECSLILGDPAALPALVVVKQHLVDQWAKEELPLYYPDMLIHHLRKGSYYDIAAHRSCKGRYPDVLVGTYGMLWGWSDHLAGLVKTVIFDEGDELRTGEETRKYSGALQISRRATYRILATGTPVHNYADEMWNVADLLEEGALGTKEEFRSAWGGKNTTDPRALGKYLQEEGIMLRRTRKDVGRELPPVSQMIHPIETDHAHIKREMDAILAMASKIVDSGTDRIERFSVSGTFNHKIRQETGVAKAPHVAAFVKLLLQSEEKVILVGHHHDVYAIWKRELAEFNPVFFNGQTSKRQQAEAKQQFINGDSRVFVLAVRSGAGINGLQKVCTNIVFGEIDWSPARHKQVIGRCNRDGQIGPIAVYFLMSDAGSDPKMMDIIELKRRIAEPITDPDAPIMQPRPEEAARQIRQLAQDVLRRYGSRHTPAPPMPAPVAGSDELFPREIIGADPQAALEAVSARAETVRVLGVDVPRTDTATHTQEELRARLAGTRQ